MFNRRSFLARSALISLTPMVPGFLARSLADQPATSDERILVVLQLDGGNDGLNTVVPFADENYARFRRRLRIPTAEILKLNGEVGLHPAMKAAAEMVNDGRLTVIQGVGYPNPDRSHFRSMAIWHQGRMDAVENSGYGWLGRALDTATANPDAGADAVFVGPQAVPRALWGRQSRILSRDQESDLALPAEWKSRASAPMTTRDADDLTGYVERVVDRSYQTARQLSEQARFAKKKLTTSYPATNLARQLSLISQMIKNEMAARVYYVSQPGYDTHQGQAGDHERLLQTLSEALRAFFDDLAAAKLQDRVVLMAFSEFGRPVEENETAGTDHGAAGPVFLAGPATVGGIVGRHPSLTDLDDGDLKMSLDFRAIYASLIQDWLQIPSNALRPTDFPCPPLFQRPTAKS